MTYAKCPHIRDQWVTHNGSRINLDHQYRVLLAKRTQELTTTPEPEEHEPG